MLSARNLSFKYPGYPDLIKDFSYNFDKGRIYGIFGPNGSGKSTLLRCLNLNLLPQSGDVFYDGVKLRTLSRKEIARHIAVLQQDAPDCNSDFNVREIIMMGRYVHWKRFEHESPSDHKILESCLKSLDIEHLAEKKISMLSGGERQRVFLARSIAQESPVLMFDEPASYLDIAHQLEFLRIIRILASEGKTVIMVYHDIVITPMFIEDAIMLKNGVIFASGNPESVFTDEIIQACFDSPISLKRCGGRNVVVSLTDSFI